MLSQVMMLTAAAAVLVIVCLRASTASLPTNRILGASNLLPQQQQELRAAPDGVTNLTGAAWAVLTRGCSSRKLGRTTGDGVACRSDGLRSVLSLPEERRFDLSRRTPCTVTSQGGMEAHCVPYFYILGAFHTGVRDLYDRLMTHQHAFVPHARRDGSYPFYFSETHAWERMLWRGCDYGGCPRRRGAGAEPIPLSDLHELGGDEGARKFFGEVAGGAFTFTWSTAHSLLHHAWDKNQTQCTERPPRTKCFPIACQAQVEYDDGIGAGRQRTFTVPWLMRAVHGHQNVRLIAMLREPGARMYSAYFFWPQYRRRFGFEPSGFTKYATEMIDAFRACLVAQGGDSIGGTSATAGDGGAAAGGSHSPIGLSAAERAALETCAINFESLSAANEGTYYHADQLLKSLYAAFLPTWFAAFGRQSLLILRAEDYWKATSSTVQRVYEFLGVGAPTADATAAAARQPIGVLLGSNATFWGDKRVVNTHPARGTRVPAPMPTDARERLSDFFAPYNAELARLLGEPRFEWRDALMQITK